MTKMKAICDTWNMIDKYGIKGWIQVDNNTVEIPDEEYNRLYEAVKNKKYISNLKK